MENPRADPILAELRAVREVHSAKFNYDSAAIFKEIQAMEAASNRTFVHLQLKPREPCCACGRPLGGGLSGCSVCPCFGGCLTTQGSSR